MAKRSSPSASHVALGEEGFQAISQGPLFAKCHVYGTRRSLVFAKCQTEALGEADGKGWGWMPSGFAKCLSSPSAWHLAKRPFRQVRFFAECLALGEAFFAKCWLRQEPGTWRSLLHQVPDFWHSANSGALGEAWVSCSEICVLRFTGKLCN